jgi:hypothetical protein
MQIPLSPSCVEQGVRKAQSSLFSPSNIAERVVVPRYGGNAQPAKPVRFFDLWNP